MEIPIENPTSPDIYTYGFDRNLNRQTNEAQSPMVYNQIEDATQAQTVTFGGIIAGTNNSIYVVDPNKGLWIGNTQFSSAPFRVNMNGDLYANSGVFNGDISGATGTFTGTVTVGSLDIPNTSQANSFHVAGGVTYGGDTWWGANTSNGTASAQAYVLNSGQAKFYAINAVGGTITGVPISSIPNNTATDISLLEFTHDLAFSVTDSDTVAWGAGTITMSNGRTFAISSGNTGNMAARTYIYLDTAVSSTVLQTTTTVSTAMGANKILMAWAQNGNGEASFQVFKGNAGIHVGSGDINIANNNWNFAGTFSASDATHASWTAGTLKVSSGTTYVISAGNTGAMTAKTYVFFDKAVATNVFQTTAVAANAILDGRILIAVAKNGTNESNFMLMNDNSYNIDGANIVTGSITANEITASTITADKMNVSQLSAIAADLGAITAGTVTGATIRTSSSNPKFIMDSTSFQGLNASGNAVFEVIISGGNAGDVIMGDDATGNYAQWDDSASTFTVFNSNSSIVKFGGTGADGALSITSGTTTLSAASASYVLKNYTSISITSTGKLAFSTPHTNGTTIILKSQGNVTITTTANIGINASSMGAAGGTGGAGVVGNNTSGGAGAGGSSMTTDGSNASGSASAGTVLSNAGAAGSNGLGTGRNNGGGGGYPAGNGTSNVATGGTAFGIQSDLGILLKQLNLIPGAGGGGGGGGDNAGYTGGTGGIGGAAFYIECKGAWNVTGTISVAAAAGGSVTACNSNGGNSGGGGGGCFLGVYNTLTADTGTYVTTGGAAETACANTAGAGGGGWSKVVQNTEFA